MSANPLRVLPQSPHDRAPDRGAVAPGDGGAALARWVPSRYNIRAVTDDGGLVLWNTYRGSMSVFRPEQKTLIEKLLSRKGLEARSEGIVDYLRERGFLVPESANEYRQLQHDIHQQQFRTDRLELILLASEDCNLRCKYCYEEFARGTMLPEVRTGVKKLVQSRLGQIEHLAVSWFGGEPLYGFRAIEDLAPFFVETVEAHGLTFHSHMTTNAYLLSREVARKLLAWRITDYQITIDGTAEDHDRNRPTREGESTYETIFRNLVAMSTLGDDFTVKIRVNYDNRNCRRLEPFMDQVQKHFGDDPRFAMGFHAVGRWGGPNDRELEVCGASAGEVGASLRAAAHQRGIRVGTLKNARLGSQVCYAARPYNFVIGASGKVMKCTIDLDMKDRNVVGALREDGTLELDKDKLAMWTEPAFENDTKCQKCVIVPLCQGTHCPQVRFDTGRSPCCSTRSRPKTELLETLAYAGRGARKTRIRNARKRPDGDAPR